jgi:putative flippase GtrA
VKKVYVLTRLTKNQVMLIIGLITAVSNFLSAILPYYLPLNIVAPTVTLIATVTAVLVNYFTIEEQQAS